MITKHSLLSFLLIIFSTYSLADNQDYHSDPDFTYLGAEAGSDGHGMPFNVFGGYSKSIGLTKSYYLGWEASLYSVPRHNGIGQTVGTGISIMPGIKLSPSTKGFLRAGLLAAKSVSEGENHIGDQFGLGVQTHLSEHWEARCEYIYREYKSIHNIETSNTIDSSEVNIGLIFLL